MKFVLYFSTLLLFLSACSSGQQEDTAYPRDLEGKKTMLQEKRAELRQITQLITQLEKEIAELDPSSKQESQLVTTIPVERKDFRHFVEIQGSVQADDLIDVTSEISGRILSLKVKEGQTVRKGQLIAELDLEQIRKQIAELETQLELANIVFDRQARLWKQNIGSEIQYLEAKNNKERLEKSLETIRFQLEKGKVYAPASGVVEREVLQNGELALPGAPIIQILNISQLKVVVDVPENYLRAVRVGEPVQVKFPALNIEQTARVSLIGRTIDSANRTFSVEINIANGQGLLKPNLLAVVLLNDYEEKDVVTIPLEIVQQEVSGQRYVFITAQSEEGPVAKKVYIETGKSYANEIVITEGLNGGEELIMEGARGLAENKLIEIQPTKTEAKNG